MYVPAVNVAHNLAGLLVKHKRGGLLQRHSDVQREKIVRQHCFETTILMIKTNLLPCGLLASSRVYTVLVRCDILLQPAGISRYLPLTRLSNVLHMHFFCEPTDGEELCMNSRARVHVGHDILQHRNAVLKLWSLYIKYNFLGFKYLKYGLLVIKIGDGPIEILIGSRRRVHSIEDALQGAQPVVRSCDGHADKLLSMVYISALVLELNPYVLSS